MTTGEYKAIIKAWGYTPRRPSYDGATLYEGPDGDFTSIPDPETLSVDERSAMLDLIRLRLGITNH